MNLSATNLFSLAGKTAVLTGASGFLGRTMGRALLANGARLVAIGRSERLETQVAAWSAEFGADRVTAHRVDMYDQESLDRTLDQIAVEEQALEILVNNAHELGPQTGFNVPEGKLESATADQWMRNLTGGVYWAAHVVQKLGAPMKSRHRGSIINIDRKSVV